MLNGNLHDFYLSLALNEAWKYQGLTYPNPAVGCAIVDKNESLLALNAHQKANTPHAELNATIDALKILNPKLNFPQKNIYDFVMKNHNGLLKESTFYVTLEPCVHHGKTPPCAFLLKELGVKQVFIGTKDTNKIASGGAKFLKNCGICVDFASKQEPFLDLIEPFKTWQNGNFSFFKLALSLNGVIDGSISSQNSKLLVHKLRDKIDSLLIGGNTVRVDRPILDARLCDGKAPDVLIYSKQKNFDKSIPLFDIKNRKVSIIDDLCELENYRFTMIEGGEGMLKAVDAKYYLLFFSNRFLLNKNFQTQLKFKPLWVTKTNTDTYGWYKKV